MPPTLLDSQGNEIVGIKVRDLHHGGEARFLKVGWCGGPCFRETIMLLNMTKTRVMCRECGSIYLVKQGAEALILPSTYKRKDIADAE